MFYSCKNLWCSIGNLGEMRAPSPSKVDTSSLSIQDALANAHAHWNAGQTDQAEILCQKVLASWPGQSDALHLMGLMSHQFGNLDLAVNYLRQACRAPRTPSVYFSNLAEMLRQQGLLIEGEQVGRRAVAIDGGSAAAWNNLGIILQELGKLKESLMCLRQVIAREPDNAEAHNNLANTLKRLGLLDQAERSWLHALAIRPNYAEPHSNLSNLFNEQGNFDRAATHARMAIDLSPRLADAYVNLAATEAARLRHEDALHWLNALLSFAPLNAVGLAARALALRHLDQLDEALVSAQTAVAVAPANGEAQNALGLVLQAMDQKEAALAAYERAANSSGPAAEKALVNRAIILMEQGDTAEAEAGFARALAAFPNSASAFFNRSDLRRSTIDDSAISQMEALLGPDGTQSRHDRMLLHFALGSAYLDTDQSDAAFRHLDCGNRLKRNGIDYYATSTSRWMTQIAGNFTPALMDRLAARGNASTLPIFVLGMPRSGTTLIEQILASHSAIHGAGELKHIERLASGLGDYPASAVRLTPEVITILGETYLARIQHLSGSSGLHIVDKMPANFLYAGLIHLILPGARIIHCRRDPVDTCLSCYSKLFTEEQPFTYDQTELGLFHRDYQTLMEHWRAVLPASHFLEVDYETVVDDLEGQVRRLLAFLGLPWDPACLAFHRTQRTVRTASVVQVRQPIYRNAVGGWRRHAANLQPLLTALGVAPR
jgi:tetratricopeptide (TPR) repeat protein